MINIKTKYSTSSVILVLGLLVLFIAIAISKISITGIWAATPNVSETQLLARCVNGEARGEPYNGQVAVAAVILNRIKHSSFPKTISGIIYQPGAFTAVKDGQINTPIQTSSNVYKACAAAMNGSDPSGGATYYYNPKTATNNWIKTRPIIKTIGNHVFTN